MVQSLIIEALWMLIFLPRILSYCKFGLFRLDSDKDISYG